MCNLDVAERQFRKLVLDDPLDATARAWLDDLQIVRRALGEEPAMDDVPLRASQPAARRSAPSAPSAPTAPTAPSAPSAARVDPLKATFEARPAPRDPIPEVETRVSPAPAAPAVKAPAVKAPPPRPAPNLPASQMLEEPTRRVDVGELEAQRQLTASPEPRAELPSPLERPAPRPGPEGLAAALAADTRDAKSQVAPPRKKPVTSPSLLKKTTGRPNATGWGAHSSPNDWEDSSTEIGEPSEMAELLLKQGYADRAVAIYERLVQAYPQREQYLSRLREIRHMMETNSVPSLTYVGAKPASRPPEAEGGTDVEIEMGTEPAEQVFARPSDSVPPTMRSDAVAEITHIEGPRVDDLAPFIDDETTTSHQLTWDEEETTMISEDTPLSPEELPIEASPSAEHTSVVAVHRIIQIK
jgi:hypothetical protein